VKEGLPTEAEQRKQPASHESMEGRVAEVGGAEL